MKVLCILLSRDIPLPEAVSDQIKEYKITLVYSYTKALKMLEESKSQKSAFDRVFCERSIQRISKVGLVAKQYYSDQLRRIAPEYGVVSFEIIPNLNSF